MKVAAETASTRASSERAFGMLDHSGQMLCKTQIRTSIVSI
jgi:hypothetical protein